MPPVYVPHTLQPIRNQFKIYTHYLIAPGHHHWLSEIFWNIIPTLIQCFTKGETKERTTCYLQRSINPMYQQESEVVGFPALTVLRRGLMPNLCGCAGASYSRRSLGSIFKLCQKSAQYVQLLSKIYKKIKKHVLNITGTFKTHGKVHLITLKWE